MTFGQNAAYAFVIAEPPPRGAVAVPMKAWQEFLLNVRSFEMPEQKIQKIHDNIWLIPLETDLLFFAKLSEFAAVKEVPLRILFLQEAPQWLRFPSTESKADESNRTPQAL